MYKFWMYYFDPLDNIGQNQLNYQSYARLTRSR